MAAGELPPGVVAAPKAGACSRCGTPYPAATHARRYGGGLRPVACGCHPVHDRAQTAPAQPTSDDPWDRAAADLGADHDTLREQIATLARDLDTERRVHRGNVAQLWRALNPDTAPTPEWYEIDLDSLLVQVQDLEADAATFAPAAIAHAEGAFRIEARRVVSLQGQAQARERDLERARRANADADRRRAALHQRVGAALGLTREQAHLISDDELVEILERTPGALTSARGGPSSEPDSPVGGAPAAATLSPTSPSATTGPGSAPTCAPTSSPTADAAAAPSTAPRSSSPSPAADDPSEYSTPASHLCGDCEPEPHRERKHDGDGCTVRGCPCTGFRPLR